MINTFIAVNIYCLFCTRICAIELFFDENTYKQWYKQQNDMCVVYKYMHTYRHVIYWSILAASKPFK